MRIPSFAVVVLLMLLAAPSALAQTTRPALSQLDAELRSLYAQVMAGTVRVRLPMQTAARLIGPDGHPLRKWAEQLDAEVVRKLQESAATRPAVLQNLRSAEQKALEDVVTAIPGESQTVTYLDDIDDSRMIAVWPREAGRGDVVGIVLNDAGYVAIPAFVAKEELAGRPLGVTAGQEQLEATFVGSDRQTNVTVLKLNKPVGKPMAFAGDKPALGSLVLVLSPSRLGVKLSIWTGGQDESAVVINAIDGTVAGFARPGQMLACGGIKPITDQLLEHGRVKRAQLGIMIMQVHPNDPIRRQVAPLGMRPALRIGKVLPESAAAGAGLRIEDLILSLAEQPVEDLPSFAAAICNRNGPTALKIIRDGKEMTVTVNLELK